MATVYSWISANGTDHSGDTNTDGTSYTAGYSTIQAWVDAAPASLVAATTLWKGECFNDAPFTNGAWFPSSATSSSYYWWLTTAPGQSFCDNSGVAAHTLPLTYDDSKGVGIHMTGSYKTAVATYANHHHIIEKLQFYYDTTYSNLSYPLINFANSPDYTSNVIRNFILRSKMTSTRDITAGNSTIIVNGVIDSLNTGAAVYGAADTRLTNLTIVRGSDNSGAGAAIDCGGVSYPYATNCAIFGWTTPFGHTLTSYPTPTGGFYNATNADITTLPGGADGAKHNLGSLVTADQFESTVTGGNRRVKSGSDLINAGSAWAAYTGNKDVVLLDRSASAPTIGGMEYIVSAQNLTDGVDEDAGSATDALYPLQVVAPEADGAKGNWTTNTGGTTNLYAAIGETYRDDATYIRSGDNPTNDAYEARLADAAVPGGANGAVFSYTIAQSGGSINATVALYQGQPSTTGELIVSWSHALGAGDTALTQWDRVLTEAQVSAITDPTDVWVQFKAGTS